MTSYLITAYQTWY